MPTDTPHSERRKAPRTAAAAELVLAAPDGRLVRGRMEDASPYGLRLALASAREAADLARTRLTVTGCPEGLAALLLGRDCHVVWTEGASLGAEFRPPLAIDIEGLAGRLEFVSL